MARVLVRVGGHILLLRWMTARVGSHPLALCAGVLGVTFAISAFVPNLVTAIAVLPIVKQLVNGLSLPSRDRERFGSVLGIAVIYGANIGGMATLVGSAANGIILVALAQADVPERHLIGFWTWLRFGAPLAFVYALGALGALWLTHRDVFRLELGPVTLPEPPQTADLRRGFGAVAVGIAGCIAGGAFDDLIPTGPRIGRYLDAKTLLEAVLCLAYCLVLMRLRLSGRDEPLLRVQDTWGGIPPRGVAWAGAAVLLAWGLDRAGVISATLRLVERLVPTTDSPDVPLYVLVPVAIIASELFSNTATALTLWALTFALASAGGWSPFAPIFGIGLAANACFMSPIATPATGMVFGGLRELSLKSLVLAGLLVDVIGGVLIVLACRFWIPWVLGLP